MEAQVELATELFELEVTAELTTELLELEATEELLGLVEQTSPVIVGFSALTPFVLPCTPKLTDCPGWIVLFQSSAVAEYGLLPDTVAFQELVSLLVAYCQPTVQPLTGVVPLLVIVMEPWKPEFHSLATV